MKTVFLSYRQTTETERTRVRSFGERLRACGINVALDQFLLDEKPEGPAHGWDKWSSDCALKTDYVIIIGSESWFQCFEKTQPPGVGLGAACEADDLRTRIYDAAGIVDNIRVILFDDTDATYISAKIKRYHRFHATRDFNNIVRWLGGKVPESFGGEDGKLKTSIPHNLPSLQPFFGREEELKQIADALDPDSRTWGALIDGPGGMGKTSLAVRAAHEVPSDVFTRIIFVSLKTRELDDDGLRDLSGFLISGLAELLNELARELGRDDIAKVAEDQRPRLLLDALRGTQTLLVLDNLESLVKRERDTLFTFVKKLPAGCKAILTSRGRIGSAAEELILEKLSERAAIDTLAELATHNPLLAKTSEAERRVLYRETGGKPLLLRWTAGQLGRGHCLTFTDALYYLRSCPEGNDPLEFIFGDLVKDLSDAEIKALCALTYFTLPAKVEHLHAIVDPSKEWKVGGFEADKEENVKVEQKEELPIAAVETALRSLTNRSLAVPSDELKAFTLMPMVADFLRKKSPEVVAETGNRLEKRAYALIIENGYENHARFPALESVWPGIAPALAIFLAGDNSRLQTVCSALGRFLNFQGRWDEWLALNEKAEAKAVAAADHYNVGWRAYHAGYIHSRRKEADAVFACAKRSAAHWAEAGARERALAIRLRGLGHQVKEDYPAAIAAYRDSLDLQRSLSAESEGVAVVLNDLALAKQHSGNLASAEKHFHEALRVSDAIGFDEGVATYTCNLAQLAIDLENWPAAEDLARKSVPLSEKIHRRELIARANRCLAHALVRQGKTDEALPHARRAVELYSNLVGSPDLRQAQAILAECEG
ncbi:MAG: tetratricopeptide repeat protein [Nitrospira sp.]|nr:tetratricopeptide repeat protein [Nitrospira sp.]